MNIKIVFIALLGVSVFASCTKEATPTTNITDNVRVILTVQFGRNDTIEFNTPKYGNGYIQYQTATQKEYDYTLTDSYPTGSGSTNYKYAENIAREWNYKGLSNVDSIQMQVYVNGTSVFDQKALGTIQYQIQY